MNKLIILFLIIGFVGAVWWVLVGDNFRRKYGKK